MNNSNNNNQSFDFDVITWLHQHIGKITHDDMHDPSLNSSNNDISIDDTEYAIIF